MGVEVEIKIVLALLAVVVAVVTYARRHNIPYPVLLVVVGLALGFVPLLPVVTLDPKVILLVFLPPLLYHDALHLSFRDFRSNMPSIVQLAIGLVAVTTIVVAVVAHGVIPDLGWAAAFVLGALVSPTDSVAIIAITERVRLPRSVGAILQGESMINDATALVAYSVALASVGGAVSAPEIGVQCVWVSAGGIAVGLLVGWGIGQVRRRLNDPPVENTISLLSGFAAYIPAQVLHVSGVLAVVAMGIYLGRLAPRIVSSQTRLQAEQMWQVVTFFMNGLIFILVGLQLRTITLSAMSQHALLELVSYAALVITAVILVRVLCVWLGAYARFALPHVRKRVAVPDWRNVAIVSWAGMRGGVSLAAALAIPVGFPQRDVVIFVCFCVILATLLGQGLSLAPLIRAIHTRKEQLDDAEEAKARFKVARAALQRLDELAAEPWALADHIDDLRVHYSEQRDRFSARFHNQADDGLEERSIAYSRLKRELLRTERDTLLELRTRSVINDEVMRRVQRDLDLEEVGLPD